jgi:undecaprenyl pyrophosphate phosphatase UppP
MNKRITDISFLAIIPIVVMAYGWYLGQLHQSMQDLAGILMFVTGAIGFIFAIGIYFLTRRMSWTDDWYVKMLMGATGVVIVFAGMVIYARIRG